MHVKVSLSRTIYYIPLALLLLLLGVSACSAPLSSGPQLSGDAVRVENATARPAAAHQNSAAYFTIVNPTATEDRLVKVDSTVAKSTELHETVEENGIFKMMPRPQGFPVPARGRVELKPGGKHVMLLELTKDLKPGDELPLTLTFEKAGQVQVTATLMDMPGMSMPGMNMGGAGADSAGASGGSMPADALAPQLSANGLYRVTAVSKMDPVTINKIHAWTLHVETADGEPVTDAEISVDGGMPIHNHGFPTAPRVTKNLGGGDYLLEGMKFNMAGQWVMDVTITAGGQTDTVHFEFELK